MTAGQMIAEGRKRAGWNRAQLARRMGVTRSAVFYWERDHAYPRPKRAARLEALLDITLPRHPRW